MICAADEDLLRGDSFVADPSLVVAELAEEFFGGKDAILVVDEALCRGESFGASPAGTFSEIVCLLMTGFAAGGALGRALSITFDFFSCKGFVGCNLFRGDMDTCVVDCVLMGCFSKLGILVEGSVGTFDIFCWLD